MDPVSVAKTAQLVLTLARSRTVRHIRAVHDLDHKAIPLRPRR